MTEWYYYDAENQKIGPISDEEFTQVLDAGAILPQTRVWRSGLFDWTSHGALLERQRAIVAATPPPLPEPPPQAQPTAGGLEYCPECHGSLPGQLFREVGGRRICGSCMQKLELKAERDRLRDAKGAGAGWLGKHLLLCAVIAVAIVVLRLGFGIFRSDAKQALHDLPKVEQFNNPPPR